jgi:hypothetical protein
MSWISCAVNSRALPETLLVGFGSTCGNSRLPHSYHLKIASPCSPLCRDRKNLQLRLTCSDFAGKQAVRRRRDSSKRVVYRSQGVGAQRKPRDLLNSRGQRAKSKIKRSPGICVFVSTKPPCYLPLPRKHFVSFKG